MDPDLRLVHEISASGGPVPSNVPSAMMALLTLGIGCGSHEDVVWELLDAPDGSVIVKQDVRLDLNSPAARIADQLTRANWDTLPGFPNNSPTRPTTTGAMAVLNGELVVLDEVSAVLHVFRNRSWMVISSAWLRGGNAIVADSDGGLWLLSGNREVRQWLMPDGLGEELSAPDSVGDAATFITDICRFGTGVATRRAEPNGEVLVIPGKEPTATGSESARVVLVEDETLTSFYNEGQVACLPEVNALVVTFGRLPHVHVMDGDGATTRVFTIAEFAAPRLRVVRQAGERKEYEFIDADRRDRVIDVIAIDDSRCLVQVARLGPLEGSVRRIRRIDTFVLDVATGDAARIPREMPRILAADRQALYGMSVNTPTTADPAVLIRVRYDAISH